MSNFPEKGLNAAISRTPQTNYLTSTAAAANAFVREEIKQREFSKLAPSEKDNAGYATGFGFPTESWIESWMTSWNWSVDLASQNIGRYLLAAMGKVTTTQPDAANCPTVYRHVFSYLPFLTTSQLPTYALLEWLLPGAGGVNRKLPSMVAKSFKIAASGLAKLDGAIAWEGSGERIAPSGVTHATHVNEIQGALNYFYSKQAELVIADVNGANPANVKCDLKKWNFSVENSQADNDWGCPRFVGDNAKLGALRSHHLTTDQKFVMDWTMKLRDNSPEHVALTDQKPVELTAQLLGELISSYQANFYRHSLTVTSYLSKYSAVDDGFEDGMAVVTVKPKVLFNVGVNKIVEVTLINTTPSYTI